MSKWICEECSVIIPRHVPSFELTLVTWTLHVYMCAFMQTKSFQNLDFQTAFYTLGTGLWTCGGYVGLKWALRIVGVHMWYQLPVA